MARSAGRGIPNTAFLSRFGYCLTDGGAIPTIGLRGHYLPSTAAPACMVNELRSQYDPRPVGDVLGIKVFLAGDYRSLVASFRGVLRDYGIDVVEVTHSLDGPIDRFLEVRPDVLVIDVCFDSKDCGENELDVYEELLACDPSAKIIILNQFGDQYIIEHFCRLDVLAPMCKDESTGMLDETVNTVVQGKEHFSPKITRLLTWSTVRDRSPNRLLDENEVWTFNLVADGASIIEIATVMGLSTKAIGHLMKGVEAKLGAESQADITELTIRHGITATALKTKS